MKIENGTSKIEIDTNANICLSKCESDIVTSRPISPVAEWTDIDVFMEEANKAVRKHLIK